MKITIKQFYGVDILPVDEILLRFRNIGRVVEASNQCTVKIVLLHGILLHKS